MTDPLASFSDHTRSWFGSAFERPTEAQLGAWRAVSTGKDALVVAPTGSGKTLAAFLWSLDRLFTAPQPSDKERLRVLYVSPLKALAVDVDRNLRSPLAGIAGAARRAGSPVPDLRVGVRTGDTPADERRRFTTKPPDILITTPESLFLLLTSAAREAMRHIDTVIIDEVHAVAGSKRGAHLALSLERLDALLPRPAQRIGLSATVRPVEEVSRFLTGGRPAEIVKPPSEKRFDLQIVVPVEDMEAPEPAEAEDILLSEGSAAGVQANSSVWPHVEKRVLELIREHRSTIVFVNSRRLAERLSSRLNELAGEEIVRAHHGSVARDQRVLIEEELKAGRLPAVVATSSLELGIDMGAVDLVIQVGAPDSVASGLQRVGRGGHQVGAVSRGLFFPRFRADLLESTVVVERMRSGEIEETRYPRNPLDVLAQQIVAMVAMDPWTVDDLHSLVSAAAPFAELSRPVLESVLDMLSGRYPSDEFAELRPRLNWDRATGMLTGRTNAQRLAVTSGGTIPDRGLFGVFLTTEKGGRVGELDEEMVYESRPGDVFMLGSSSWLIEEITHDRVLVTPAPGAPGKMPFWHGDAPGRPLELGRAIGAFTRRLMRMPAGERVESLARSGLDEFAARNLVELLQEQKAATGAVPDDKTIVVERFRDELGDWRVCIHSFFGARVHAPWAQAIEALLKERTDLEVQTIYSDDGIVIRLPEAQDAPPAESVVVDPDEIEDLVVGRLGGSALFASRFRECAARALLLPRRNPRGRTPLWQQRQRSASLLQVASKYASFPIVLETVRECLQDVFDLPALQELMASLARREVRIVEVESQYPSPLASSLLFGYIASFMYEGDAPLAERRAQALSLDRSLLAEILGREELRELIDAGALAEIELELQHLADGRKATDADRLHDLLRDLGDLAVQEVRDRIVDPADASAWLQELERSRRAVEVRIAGESRWVAIEDAARLRDALGVALPVGIPESFLEEVADPVADLVGRYARTHGPFVPSEIAERLGLGSAVVTDALARLEAAGRVVDGEFRPGGSGTEWVDSEVLRKIRRRSLAALRKEIEPAPPEALARFYLAWQGVGRAAPASGGADAVYRAVELLQGVPAAASALESQVLASRVPGYSSALLDELCASGEVVWAGAGAIGSDDGYVVLALAADAAQLLPDPVEIELDEVHHDILRALRERGASFFRQISDAVGATDDKQFALALWDLAWAGHITNDTLAPMRALFGGRTRSTSGRHRRGPVMPSRMGPPSVGGRWSLVEERTHDTTVRMHAITTQLLRRYGIVTPGVVNAERIKGGFASVYPVLKAMEERGTCRRGYFVEGLGGAQFALPGAVDRMRSLVEVERGSANTELVATTDPANPYGAALMWPQREGGHRAGRKAGAVVVLADGAPVIYVERGGRSLLGYTDDPQLLQPAADVLALAAREGTLGRLSVERADGEAVYDTPFAEALVAAGFRPSSRGLRLRA